MSDMGDIMSDMGDEEDLQERARLLTRLSAHPGLCATCTHLRLLASPRSIFVRCGKAATDPAFPRYPPLPVRRCAGYNALPVGRAPGGVPGGGPREPAG